MLVNRSKTDIRVLVNPGDWIYVSITPSSSTSATLYVFPSLHESAHPSSVLFVVLVALVVLLADLGQPLPPRVSSHPPFVLIA